MLYCVIARFDCNLNKRRLLLLFYFQMSFADRYREVLVHA